MKKRKKYEYINIKLDRRRYDVEIGEPKITGKGKDKGIIFYMVLRPKKKR